MEVTEVALAVVRKVEMTGVARAEVVMEVALG